VQDQVPPTAQPSSGASIDTATGLSATVDNLNSARPVTSATPTAQASSGDDLLHVHQQLGH
jgi:hypothetical protein